MTSPPPKLNELQPYELRRGVEEIVKQEQPDLSDKDSRKRANWIYSLAMGAARCEALAELESYRNEKTDGKFRVKEKHNSVTLGKYLNAVDMEKPDEEFEAHHIVSGKHKYARAARVILARYNIRIDDPDNGIWLPNFKRNIPHPCFPDAPAHRTIHTDQYYMNVNVLLNSIRTKDNPNAEQEIRGVLRKIGKRLVAGCFPYQKNNKIDVNKW